MTTDNEIQMHKNFITRDYEEPNAAQRFGNILCDKSGLILNFLVHPMGGDDRNLPVILNITGAVGAAIGAGTGLVLGTHRAWELVANEHANLLVKAGSAVLTFGVLPVIAGGIVGLFGGVVGLAAGVALSAFTATYTLVTGAVGCGLRGAGDLYSAARPPARSAARAAQPKIALPPPRR